MLKQLFDAIKILIFTIVILIMMIGLSSIVNSLYHRLSEGESIKEASYLINNFTFIQGGQNDYS